jgi:hypothetical protein
MLVKTKSQKHQEIKDKSQSYCDKNITKDNDHSKTINNILKDQNQWILTLIDGIFKNTLREDFFNMCMCEMIGLTKNDIKFGIDITIMNIIHQSQINRDNFICVNLTPIDTSYGIHIKLMYIPQLIETVEKKLKNFTQSGLVWGIVGNDLVKHAGCLPCVTFDNGNTVLPLYRSNREIWYPFHEYKFRIGQIVLDLILLYKYLHSDSLLRKKTLINNPKSVFGLLGLLDNNISPDLNFVKDYDDTFQTILIDHIKGNPTKGLKPHKIITYSENGKIETYKFNFNQFGSSSKIISEGISRVFRQIPILYDRRLIWRTNSNHKKSVSMMENEINKFWKSKCMVAMLSFSRYVRVLVKSTSRDTMYIIDPWKKFNNYEQNTIYQTIVKIVNSMGLNFVFLERNCGIENVKIEGSYVLGSFSRAISVCMNLMNLIIEYGLSYDLNTYIGDIINENNIIECIHEPINDSIALIATSVMKKEKKVRFNPVIDFRNYQ